MSLGETLILEESSEQHSFKADKSQNPSQRKTWGWRSRTTPTADCADLPPHERSEHSLKLFLWAEAGGQQMGGAGLGLPLPPVERKCQGGAALQTVEFWEIPRHPWVEGQWTCAHRGLRALNGTRDPQGCRPHRPLGMWHLSAE